MIKYLAFDTSGDHLTVIARNGKKISEQFVGQCGLKHSTQLLGTIERVLAEVGMTVGEVEVMCAVVGPGSFTGIRIGVSTLKALCFASRAKCVAVNSFEVLAYNRIDGKQLCLIDAKHGSYYMCAFEGEKSVFEKFAPKSEAEKFAAEYKPTASQPLEGFDVTCVSLAVGLRNAVESKYSSASPDFDSVKPYYIRKSQPEEAAVIRAEEV